MLIGGLLSITGCSSDSTSTNKGFEKSQNFETSVENTEKNIKNVYADDEVVNNFIIEYNKISKEPLKDIEKGNIRTKYFASNYGYFLEILHTNSTDKVKVSINITNDTVKEGVVGMRDVFHNVVKAIEPSLSDDEIYAYFDNLVKNEHMITEDAFSTMEVTYVPDIYGRSRGRIDVSVQ
ncbi:MAG: hypothetical protein Q4E28_05220 [Clostridia bacterium]|nr:hypothetical protein [Clostridia bacterium]